MRKLLILPIVIALAGCQSIGNGQPTRLGKKKFELSYVGPEQIGLNAAQSFCNERGYSYAAVVGHAANRIMFFCIRNGERLDGFTSSRGRFICMNAAGGAKVCGLF